MKNLIKRLTEEYGPSGFEEKVVAAIKDEIAPFVDEVEVDKLGSLVAVKKGDGARVMLAAHMDEIGLIVTHVDKEGFLRFSTVGGVSAARLSGIRVTFKDGQVGTIGLEKTGNTIDKMFIDIGATSREDAESKVSIGDFAVLRRRLEAVRCRHDPAVCNQGAPTKVATLSALRVVQPKRDLTGPMTQLSLPSPHNLGPHFLCARSGTGRVRRQGEACLREHKEGADDKKVRKDVHVLPLHCVAVAWGTAPRHQRPRTGPSRRDAKCGCRCRSI